MSTLTIPLKEEHIAGLQKKANRLGLTPEVYAQKAIEHLLESGGENGVAWVDAQTFERALRESIQENDELYRRLAQ